MLFVFLLFQYVVFLVTFSIAKICSCMLECVKNQSRFDYNLLLNLNSIIYFRAEINLLLATLQRHD